MQNSEVTFTEECLKDLEVNADKHWDAFYDIHQNRWEHLGLINIKKVKNVVMKPKFFYVPGFSKTVIGSLLNFQNWLLTKHQHQ